MNSVIQQLRRSVLLRDWVGLTDGQLLEDYLSRRDNAALGALVRRHGPMVWGVCRRVLRDYHDAEDAFQATFLVLVRRAASIAARELLANWLYGVAYQTALKARATAARRKGREKQMTETVEPAAVELDLWHDLQPLLDDELSRLPDKYRSVIVLCDLSGRTRKEAARQLGVPEGSVAGWLARARVMLAKRLARRGVALSGGGLAAVLSQEAASAGVPTSVVSSTIEAASLFAAGQAAGVVTANVAAITEGVLNTMFQTKLKGVSAALVLLAVLALAARGLPDRTQAAESQSPPKVPAARDGGKPQVAPKPVVVKDDAPPFHVAWASDGKTIVTLGYDDEEVELKDSGKKLLLSHLVTKNWDATGKLVQSLGEEKDTLVLSAAFSSDARTAALVLGKQCFDREKGAAGEPQPGEVRVLNAKTWEVKHKFTHGHNPDDVGMTVTAVAISPDGKRLALAGLTRGLFKEAPPPGYEHPACLKLWDVEKEKLIELQVKPDEEALKPIHCLVFSPDGKLIAAGGEKDGKIQLFDGRTGKAKAIWDDHTGMVARVAFSPDGSTLASVAGDDSVKLWDVRTGKPRATLKRNKLSDFAFSPNGKLLATLADVEQEKDEWRSELILWDAKTGEMKRALVDALSGRWHTLAFSPDGKAVAVAGIVKEGEKRGGEMRLIPLD